MTRGIDFVIKVNTGTVSSPVWTQVAGQRGGTLNRDVETVDITSKDSEGWLESDYGFASWSIESDGLLVENDLGYTALEDAYMSKTNVLVQFVTAAGTKYQGDALITSFPLEAPYDDNASYSVTITGTGALSKL